MPKGVAASDTQLSEIVVTGSLIPQARAETSVPLTVITAEDLENRGFPTIADALQQSSFSTGSVQGPQFTNGFTPGAQTLSMFGLSPSYVKYLIDGHPMSNYPALYNAGDVIVSISGIPEEFVDHIDILPGGQSSLYGSDAIAGVVNVILKKELAAPILDVRYGFYKDGGGTDRRIALADSLKWGPATVLFGAHYQKTDPIWGYERDLTAHYYAEGTSPITAERDYLIYDPNFNYEFLDPNNCSTLASQFGSSLRKYDRPERGDYCGTTRSGFSTIGHGSETTEAYLHGTGEVSDHLQLYADALFSNDFTKFSNSAQYWSTDFLSGLYYDPRIGTLLGMQRYFSTEEAGGVDSTLVRLTTNTSQETLGGRGSVGYAAWTYDVGITHAEQKLKKHTHVLFADATNSYFSKILGPDLGPDPIYGYYPTYTPDYAAFYQALTPAQYGSFSGHVNSYSRTTYNEIRAQLTNASLFSLPGGQAGIALVAEGGNEGWSYVPDQLLIDGKILGYISVTGSGHRSRSAFTSELRLPLLSMFTVNLSGRYDDYKVAGDHVGRSTFNLGIELRPQESLLLRGRYGTAFKAPTLADEFQGRSRYSSTVTDYYQCAQGGYSGPNIGNCPFTGVGFLGTTSGNTNLHSITASVWSAGAVWLPFDHVSINADYLHWAIHNEVSFQSADQLANTESKCRLGTLNIQSPTCAAALSQITRDITGNIVEIVTPKVNVSQENVNAVTMGLTMQRSIGRFGAMVFEASWSDLFKHTYQLYPADPLYDVLRDPTVSSDFKSKVNASLTWTKGRWSSTFYANRLGGSPNNLAGSNGYGTPGAASLSPWTVCNFSTHFQVTDGLRVSATADNVFDKMPPPDHSYSGLDNIPYNSANYNVYGRFVFVEATYQFGH